MGRGEEVEVLNAIIYKAIKTDIKHCGRRPWEILQPGCGEIAWKVYGNPSSRFAGRWAYE